MTDQEPQCAPEDEFFEQDMIHLRSLKGRVEADDNLTGREFAQLNELQDRWNRYCAFRGRRIEWRKQQAERASRPSFKSDPDNRLGEQLAAMRIGRRGGATSQVGPASKPAEARGLALIQAGLNKQRG